MSFLFSADNVNRASYYSSSKKEIRSLHLLYISLSLSLPGSEKVSWDPPLTRSAAWCFISAQISLLLRCFTQESGHGVKLLNFLFIYFFFFTEPHWSLVEQEQQSSEKEVWTFLNIQSERKSSDVLAAKWLHSRQGRYEETSGNRIKGERRGRWQLWEISPHCYFIPSVFFFFFKVACRLTLPKERCRQQNVLILSKVESYRRTKVDEKGRREAEKLSD